MTPSYALGLVFIFLVSIIWSASSIVVQHLYHDMQFDSPFILTYVGTSLFVIFVPMRLLWERRRRIRAWCFGRRKSREGWTFVRQSDSQDEDGPPTNTLQEPAEEKIVIIPWRSSSVSQMRRRGNARDGTTISFEGSVEDSRRREVPFSLSIDEGVDSFDNQSVEMNSLRDTGVLLGHVDHFKMAAKIAPFWFVSNYFYNLSLEYTSITSSTVLASTGSLFTFLFAVVFGDEKWSTWKMAGVSLCMVGSIVTGLSDIHDSTDAYHDRSLGASAHHHHGHHAENHGWENPNMLWGDIAGLISAAGYGTYTVLIRTLCPKNENLMSMQLLLGYIGVINMIFLMPVTIKLLLFDMNNKSSDSPDSMDEFDDISLIIDDDGAGDVPSSTTSRLTWVIFWFLVGKGLTDNVLSDYLWARAVILTSATVATVGVGLTIPLAMVSDWIMGHGNVTSIESIVGACAVLIGFICVNMEGEQLPTSQETSNNRNPEEGAFSLTLENDGVGIDIQAFRKPSGSGVPSTYWSTCFSFLTRVSRVNTFLPTIGKGD